MAEHQRPRILTWNIHGSYLYYLSLGDYIIYVPYNEQRSDRYAGRGTTFPFGNNVIEIPAHEIKGIEFDLILFQADENYLIDQHELLSESQRTLPKIYIEHDPPWGHPTDEVHPIKDKNITLVHVTHYNRLMWKADLPDIRVICHGVTVGPVTYHGTIKKGIVVINNLPSRGRMLGLDIFNKVREVIPLDLVGMGSEDYGIGEVLHPQLPAFMSQYRFFFNPIRYTSLGLSVCEAMMIGMPVVGLACTELPTVIKNEASGFVHNDINYLIDKMSLLLDVPSVAYDISYAASQRAKELFAIERFTTEWRQLFIEKINSAIKEQ
ncbi:glycosyltransferase family 4 protein [Sphingobacterium sp. SGG-5]|nr:glycosyltransferase family 4 protein [Sphingobacterium sp. SGG-5]